MDMTTHDGEVERRWLSYRDAARYTGLSEETLRRLAAQGKLTVSRPTPKNRRLDRRELDQLMQAVPPPRLVAGAALEAPAGA